MWHCASEFSSNQQWLYNATSKLLSSRIQASFCLSASGMKMAACNSASRDQQWAFQANGLLQNVGSGNCLTVAATPTMEANFTAPLTGTYFFSVEMGRGFGAGFNGFVYLTLNSVPVLTWMGLTNMPDALTYSLHA